jgi:protein-S-isoprenylcysteine O-methyltransferase Ste14
MVTLGNFFFKTRNYLFPFFYVVLFLPFPRITADYKTIFLIGLVIALFGQFVRALTIGLAYVIRGGKNRRIYADGLVTDGLFSHCRNPMYVGNVLLVIGMSILSNSVVAVAVMIPLFIFIYQAIIKAEEDYLLNAYGKGYTDYCNNVNRWFPKLKGITKTIAKSDFNLKKVIYKEYGTTFLWTLGTTLLFGYNTYWLHTGAFSITDGVAIASAVLLLGLLYLIARTFKKAHLRKVYAERERQANNAKA